MTQMAGGGLLRSALSVAAQTVAARPVAKILLQEPRAVPALIAVRLIRCRQSQSWKTGEFAVFIKLQNCALRKTTPWPVFLTGFLSYRLLPARSRKQCPRTRAYLCLRMMPAHWLWHCAD